MMKVLILALMSFSANSLDQALCPSESIPVEYISPVTQNRKMACGYMKDGQFVKHGQEIEYRPSGNQTVFYSRGREVPTELSGEEADETFSLIRDLLKIFAIDREGVKEGPFKIFGCGAGKKTWVSSALTKTSVDKKYKFSDGCDLSGSFTAGFLDEFPVSFKLKSVKFTRATMFVKMMIKQSPTAIRYRFEVREGSVMGDLKTMNFHVEYEVDINPLTGSAKYATEEGSITLTKITDKEVNISRPLMFTR